MGNNQSQSSDEEVEKPHYTYHESVLQEAVVEAAKRPVAVDCASDDEPFFSADEGDSVGSITPPRTRPESSSSEDSSDEEDSEEEVNASNNQNEDQFSSGGGRNMKTKKSCGQCNVSRYEEQDSIGPEVTRALRHFSGNDSSLRSSSRRSQSTRNTNVDSDILSPFRPIQTPLSLDRSLCREHGLSISADKKRSNRKPNKELEIPTNASLSGSRGIYSSRRKRLAYVESSDSEDDEEDLKRAKYDSSSRKRHKQEEGSESDSNYSGRRVPEHQNLMEVGQTERNKTRRSRHRSSDSENEDLSHFKEQKNQSYGDRKSPSDGTPQSLSAGRGIKRLRIGAFHPPPNYSNSNVRNQTSTTFKMGMQAVRNANGKILPIRHQANTSKNCDQNQERNDASPESSNLERLDNIAQSIRRRGVNATVTDRSLKRKSSDSEIHQPLSARVIQAQNVQITGHVVDTEMENKHNVSNNAISNNRNVPVSPDTVSENNSKSKEDVSLSPFHGVVLTPPSGNNNGDVSNQQKTDDVEIDVMEVDDESSYRESVNKKERLILKGKRLGKSAAERFRNFWSEKKIGSNIKSIFATKLKSPSPSNKSSSPLLVRKTSLPSFNISPLSRDKPQSGAMNQSQNSLLASTSASSPSGIFHQLRSSSRNSLNSLSSHHQLPGSSTVTSSPTKHHAGTHSPNQKQQSRNRTPPRQPSARTTSNSTRIRRSPRISSSASQSSSVIYLPQSSQYQVLHFRLADRLSVSVSLGDISDQTTTGIVNWTDGALTHTITECSKKIAARAGALMRAGCNDYLENKNGELESPDVLTTPAGGRFSRDVETLLHVAAPVWVEGGEDVNSRALLEVHANCLRFAAEREGLTSLSFPLIGLGTFPADMCIQVFFDSLLVYLAESSSSSSSHDLSSVSLVISDAVITDFAEDLLWPCLERITSDGLETVMSETYNRYFGSNLYEAHQNIVNERSNYSRNSPSSELATEDSSRAISGRPRVKRPRL